MPTLLEVRKRVDSILREYRRNYCLSKLEIAGQVLVPVRRE